jgi:3-hydroxybutyryl-CoA dehydratase
MKKGDVFNLAFSVTEDVYSGFLQAFKDHNPLHTVDEVAQKKGFKQKVMHGNILNGFLSYFIGEGLPVKDVIIHSQSISFHKPVYLNDVLQFRADVIEYSEAVNVIQFAYSFSKEGIGKVAKGKIQIGITK